LADFTIRVQNLGKRFNRDWIFRDITYTFHSKNIYVVTGPNGSGKSTLLQVLWGQMPASNGAVQYFRDDSEIPSEDIFKHITIATPYMDLIDEFTLLEQIQFHVGLKRMRGDISVDEIIEKLQLSSARNKAIADFSSGMRQRLKLGLAFFTHADVIFLDEPGTNLDAQAFQWYVRHLRDLPADSLIIMASNQPAEYPENAHKIDIFKYK